MIGKYIQRLKIIDYKTTLKDIGNSTSYNYKRKKLQKYTKTIFLLLRYFFTQVYTKKEKIKDLI